MKVVLAISALAAALSVNDFARDDAPLEPSLRHEVDHACARARAWLERQGAQTATNALCAAHAADPLFRTNALGASAIAVKLVSAQKGEGWWLTPTNAAPTRLALEILKGL